MSPTGSEPWTEVLDRELEDSRKSKDPLPLLTFPLEEEITSQFIKFKLVSWYGYGGGLQYFDIQKKGGGTISIIKQLIQYYIPFSKLDQFFFSYKFYIISVYCLVD